MAGRLRRRLQRRRWGQPDQQRHSSAAGAHFAVNDSGACATAFLESVTTVLPLLHRSFANELFRSTAVLAKQICNKRHIDKR